MMFGAKIIIQYRKTTKILFVHRLSNATSVQNNLLLKKKAIIYPMRGETHPIPWEQTSVQSHPVGQKFFAVSHGMGWDGIIPSHAEP